MGLAQIQASLVFCWPLTSWLKTRSSNHCVKFFSFSNEEKVHKCCLSFDSLPNYLFKLQRGGVFL